MIDDLLAARRQQRVWAFGFGILLLFVVSGVKSCSELKYSMFGETTTARVRRTTDYDKEVRVGYTFTDAQGKAHDGSASAPRGWTGTSGSEVDIVYLPGNPGKSTLVETRSMVFPMIFGGMIVLMAGWIGYIWWQAKQGVFG